MCKQIILLILFLLLYCILKKVNIELFNSKNMIEENNHENLYLSITTIPSRIKKIKPIIDSILTQNQKFKKLLFNIPYKSKRFNTEYTIPKFLNEEKYKNKIKIIRCTDYGPATKFMGCLDYLEKNNINKKGYMIFMDDDRLILNNTIKNLFDLQLKNNDCIISNYGGTQGLPVKIPWGAGCISIPLKLINNKEIKDFFKKHESKCRYVDDVFIYKYFVMEKKNKIIYNKGFKLKHDLDINGTDALFKEKGIMARYDNKDNKGLNTLCYEN